MECKQNENKMDCTCTYTTCSRRGMCCECVQYHRSNNEIPGCFFPPAAERSYNRSVENFVKVMSR